MALGPPEDNQHRSHHETLVEVVPALHGQPRQPQTAIHSHQVLVVESAEGSQHGSSNGTHYPAVMAEVDAFLTPAAAKQEEAHDGQHDTCPLQEVQPFAKDEQSSDEHHDGPSGIDGADNRDGQMLHADVAKQPAAQHDAGFQHDVTLHVPPSEGRLEGHWQEDDGTEQRVEEQDWNNRIAPQRVLLADVIEAQQGCTQKGKG